MKKFISFSGGVESTTMCLLYGKGATAIVCDTGDEEPEMYERWDFVENAMNIIHDGDFKLIRIKPFVKHKGKYYDTLKGLALGYGFFPGSGSRYCTRQLKIEPIDLYLNNQAECELMVGLNADEIELREGNQSTLPNVKYTTPLADDGHSRADCILLLKQYGLEPNFPPYMKRGGCRTCFFRGKKEAKAKYFFNKEGFLQDQQFEILLNESGTRKLTKSGRKKFFGINQAFPSGYQSVIDECEQEISMFGLEEMKSQYKNISEHKACGLFCHR
jgi:3'-phosphoadenosine 5'-phosphosulfate sulfotransferase (PAPS reductase)/FAD synthetase